MAKSLWTNHHKLESWDWTLKEKHELEYEYKNYSLRGSVTVTGDGSGNPGVVMGYLTFTLKSAPHVYAHVHHNGAKDECHDAGPQELTLVGTKFSSVRSAKRAIEKCIKNVGEFFLDCVEWKGIQDGA